jgi:hypothetical protein
MMVDLDDGLRELGLAAKDVHALLLVPAAAVAWADGEADMQAIANMAGALGFYDIPSLQKLIEEHD